MIKTVMVALEETISIPLAVTEQRTIRIKSSRVSLDSIVHHFKLGATAEQIVQSFPSLSLGDVYSSIAYYVIHRQEIEESLQEQEIAADALQEQLESKPDYQAEIAELRSRHFGAMDCGSREWRSNADGIDRTVILRLLIDQDLDHVILRGRLLRVPSLEVNAHQVGFSNPSKSYACRNALESFMVDL